MTQNIQTLSSRRPVERGRGLLRVDFALGGLLLLLGVVTVAIPVLLSFGPVYTDPDLILLSIGSGALFFGSGACLVLVGVGLLFRGRPPRRAAGGEDLSGSMDAAGRKS